MKKMNKYQNSVLIMGTILAILALAVILFPHRNVSLATPTKTATTKVAKKRKNIAEKILIYHILILIKCRQIIMLTKSA